MCVADESPGLCDFGLTRPTAHSKFTDCVYRRLLLLLISLADRPFPYVLAVVQKAESL